MGEGLKLAGLVAALRGGYAAVVKSTVPISSGARACRNARPTGGSRAKEVVP